MRVSNFFYYLSQGWQYFLKNRNISTAAVGVLAACLFIIGSFWSVYQNVDFNLRVLEEHNHTVLFIDDDFPREQISALEQRILAIANVESCVFQSREQAWEEYRNDYPDDSDILRDLEESGFNPLRESFTVTLYDTSLYEETMYQLEQIQKQGGIARIRKQNQQTIRGVLSVARTIYFICYWIMGLLFAASLVIIMNTIRIARYSNQEQISIMKYVGATDWFIRWPFIFEGALIGLLAAGVSFFAVWYAYTKVLEGMSGTIRVLTIVPFSEISDQMLLVSVACGMAISVLGSTLSIRKYFDA